MAADWVSLGGDWRLFWDMTLREYVMASKAMQARRAAEMQRARVLQQELGGLISFAFNNPKKMPDLTKDQGPQRRPGEAPEMTVEEVSAALQAAFAGINQTREVLQWQR